MWRRSVAGCRCGTSCRTAGSARTAPRRVLAASPTATWSGTADSVGRPPTRSTSSSSSHTGVRTEAAVAQQFPNLGCQRPLTDVQLSQSVWRVLSSAAQEWSPGPPSLIRQSLGYLLAVLRRCRLVLAELLFVDLIRLIGQHAEDEHTALTVRTWIDDIVELVLVRMERIADLPSTQAIDSWWPLNPSRDAPRREAGRPDPLFRRRLADFQVETLKIRSAGWFRRAKTAPPSDCVSSHAT